MAHRVAWAETGATGYYGTYHKMSPAHLNRYVSEFAGRHNNREDDTLNQMITMVRAWTGSGSVIRI